MKYKLLVLDADTAIIREENSISTRNINMILKAQESGIKVVIISKNPVFSVLPYAKLLKLDKYGGYIMAYNGTKIVDCKTLQVIKEYKIDPIIVEGIIDLLSEKEISLLVFDEPFIVSQSISQPHIADIADSLNLLLKENVNIKEYIYNKNNKFLITGNQDELLTVINEIEELYPNQLSINLRSSTIVEILPKNWTGVDSLDFILKETEINRDETIVVATHNSDIPLLQSGGLAVAMADAQEDVKSCADYITKSKNDNGVAHLINKYIVQQEQRELLTVDDINLNIKDNLISNLGIVCTDIREDYVEATMPVDIRTKQVVNVLHGGATLALAETIAGFGSVYLCEENEITVGMQVSGNHISSAHVGDEVRAIGKILHKGRSTHVWNIDVFSSTGKLVSSVRVINSILKKR